MPVFAAVNEVSKALKLQCRRAGDIWANPAVLQDVGSLIDASQVVLADCTWRDPIAFYEIGIAHTLGKEVILITQSEVDVPFDLRRLRTVKYLKTAEGLEKFKGDLRTLLADFELPF